MDQDTQTGDDVTNDELTGPASFGEWVRQRRKALDLMRAGLAQLYDQQLRSAEAETLRVEAHALMQDLKAA
jgi:hypothetical protein